MKENKSKFIEDIISRMTIEQKVGQCFVLGMMGTMITHQIVRRIRQFQPAGIRSGHGIRVKNLLHDPYATGEEFRHRVMRPPKIQDKDFLVGINSPWCTHEQFCRVINDLKQLALESNGLGIPLHFTLDTEGNMSADYCRGGMKFFPHPMGIASSGDPRLARDVAWAIARQARAVGYDWIHSPVLDVNTNPMNPEISTRSYGETPEVVARFGLAALDGFREGGLIATGKHFPGRGACEDDAHHDLPVIDLPEKEMRKHLEPFQALIDAGIPAIMSAHTLYPSLDPSGRPPTLSKRILTDLLKNEMGFRGAITTDAISMGGIVSRWELTEACIEALKAGADLVLLREEGSIVEEVMHAVYNAAFSGELPEERLDDALRRSLGVKYDYGLFEKGGLRDESAAASGARDPRVARIAARAAQAGVKVIRDRDGLLPLKTNERILLIEQAAPLHVNVNDFECHPALLWKKMFAYSPNVGIIETQIDYTESDRRRVLDRAEDFDKLVFTNYHWRKYAGESDFISQFIRNGKRAIVVTNNPYPLTIRDEYGTVIITYGVSPECMEAVAARLFGAEAIARNVIEHYAEQTIAGAEQELSMAPTESTGDKMPARNSLSHD